MALNVMVVDDSSVMRSIIIKTLKLCGIDLGEIYQAANGVEGLKVLGENWIDVALIDINMPEMNGEELLEKIRENPETVDLKVIVISTESSETRIDNLIRMGASFIHKPFTPETIRQTILQSLGVLNEQGSSEGGIAEDSEYDF